MIGIMIIMDNKRALVLLAFSLASVTASLFVPMYTGALTASDDYARCDACHIQEQDEFSRTRAHMTIQCTNCHTVSEFAPDLYSHNATTFACTYCHTEQNATQFNNDAHNNFSNASNATSIFTESNEMCVGCHTYIEMEVEWHSYKGMNITSAVNINGAWSLDYSKYGDNVTTNYTNYTDFLNRTNRT